MSRRPVEISNIATMLADGRRLMWMYSGNDDQIVPLLFRSARKKGVISVLSNVAPAQTHEICASYFRGDVKESARLQLRRFR